MIGYGDVVTVKMTTINGKDFKFYQCDCTFSFSPRSNDRRSDDSSTNKGASSETWKPKLKNEQQNRDDRRTSSSQQQASPSSSERHVEAGDTWQTVEKKRYNSSV